jgi:hypothetical protein
LSGGCQLPAPWRQGGTPRLKLSRSYSLYFCEICRCNFNSESDWLSDSSSVNRNIFRENYHLLKMTVFLDIGPRSLVEVDRLPRSAYCFSYRPDDGDSKCSMCFRRLSSLSAMRTLNLP